VLELADVQAAAEVLRGVAHRTPVLRSRRLDALLGAEVHLKAEPFQRTGSFKFRGAYHAIARMDPAERARGVITTSSGNHAQAVALAASLHGTTAVVLMPEDAPPSKLAATRGYGAEVVTFDRYATDREDLTEEVAAERGLPIVHAYDDERIMAGQGTVALELLEDAGALDLLVVCVGGGGLIGGCATAAKGLAPGVRVVGVEPEARPAARRALAEGGPQIVPVPRTLADGQQTASIGRRPWEVVDARVDEVVGVEDAALLDAVALLFRELKLVVEPSGASALAALLSGRVDARGLRVGVTLSGGNVDLGRFAALFADVPPGSSGG
jgi:threonine dehydratase